MTDSGLSRASIFDGGAGCGAKAQKVVEAQLEKALADGKKSLLEFMRDEEYPPGFRGEMAKAAAPYVHSKAPEAEDMRKVDEASEEASESLYWIEKVKGKRITENPCGQL
jgi:hypothetical protein